MPVSLSLSCPNCHEVFLAPNCTANNPVQCPHCSGQFSPGETSIGQVAPVGDFGPMDERAEKSAAKAEESARQAKSMLLIAIPVAGMLLAGYFVIFAQSQPANPEAESSVSADGGANWKPRSYFDRAFTEAKRIVSHSDWKQMAADVRKPDQVAPIMEWFYDRTPIEPVNLISYDGAEYLEIEGERFVRMNIVTEDYRRAVAVLEDTADGFKLDWETSSGVHELQWTTFKESTPTEAYPMRVEVRRSSLPDRYFYAAKLSPETALGIRIWSKAMGDSVFAVVPTTSALGAELVSLLDDGATTKNWHKSVKMMLEISYPETRTPEDRVEVASFIQEGWLVTGSPQ